MVKVTVLSLFKMETDHYEAGINRQITTMNVCLCNESYSMIVILTKKSTTKKEEMGKISHDVYARFRLIISSSSCRNPK